MKCHRWIMLNHRVPCLFFLGLLQKLPWNLPMVAMLQSPRSPRLMFQSPSLLLKLSSVSENGLPGLVNVNKKLWKDPPFSMAKSTISMAIFHSKLLVYQRVYHGIPPKQWTIVGNIMKLGMLGISSDKIPTDSAMSSGLGRRFGNKQNWQTLQG